MKAAVTATCAASGVGLTALAAIEGSVAALVVLVALALAGGYALGWRHAVDAARRARARHNAEENRRRTEQEQKLAAMNRDQRRAAAQTAAREVSRQGGRTKRGRRS